MRGIELLGFVRNVHDQKPKWLKLFCFLLHWVVVLFQAKPTEISSADFEESANVGAALAYDKNNAACPLCFMNGNYLISDEK